MPETKIKIYCEEDGEAPLITWLGNQSIKIQNKSIALIDLLAEKGNDLRRPLADILEQGVWELRPLTGKVNPRILYSFVGRQKVLLSHGLIKIGAKIPRKEITRAVKNRRRYLSNPSKHTYRQ